MVAKALVVRLPESASDLGSDSRYLLTPSPKPRLALAQLRARVCAEPVVGLTIEWPTSPSGRIKRVISRSGTRRRYVIPSYRYGDREAHGEAPEEAAACILLDACAGVEFQEQPARFIFEWCGESNEHIPDLLIASHGRYEFWECKRPAEVAQFWIRKRSERLRLLLAPYGITYRVVTSKELCRDHYLANAKQLRRFAKHPVSESVRMESELRIQRAGTMTVQDLSDVLDSPEPTADVLALIYRGNLCADLSQKLTNETPLLPSDRSGGHPWVWQIFESVNA